MLKVVSYTVKLDEKFGGYRIVPYPWERLTFPKTFPTEHAARRAVSILEQAVKVGQEFIPVICDDNVIRLYYIPSNFCPKQFLFNATQFAFLNNFKSVAQAAHFYLVNKDRMQF